MGTTIENIIIPEKYVLQAAFVQHQENFKNIIIKNVQDMLNEIPDFIMKTGQDTILFEDQTLVKGMVGSTDYRKSDFYKNIITEISNHLLEKSQGVIFLDPNHDETHQGFWLAIDITNKDV